MSNEELALLLSGQMAVECFHTFGNGESIVMFLDGDVIEFCAIDANPEQSEHTE